MHDNRYDELATTYRQSHQKPDKRYSILPTILDLAGDLRGCRVLDIGCGDGFFTRALAQAGAAEVVGIDNSWKQIQLAKRLAVKNIEYRVADMFTADLPSVDVIVMPFVLNYAKTRRQLKDLLSRIAAALSPTGRLILVVDLPTGHNLKRFGAVKTILGEPADGSPIKIDLYNHDQPICTLFSTYFTPSTIDKTLKSTGLQRIEWHQPIIDPAGIKQLGMDFWKGYQEHPELGYIVARR